MGQYTDSTHRMQGAEATVASLPHSGDKHMAEPFKIAVSDERLKAIRERLVGYDWDQLPDAGGWTAGIGKADLRRLVDYWTTEFDWRSVEERLNRLPHYTAEIEGERLHFIHVSGDGTKPPLLLLHGWPGSFIEFEALIEPLVADGHDVVVPSLPGFAFSSPLGSVVGPRRIAQRLHKLMVSLFGDARYFIQGGDWGASVSCWMAYQQPDAVRGIHINMVNVTATGAEPTTPEELDWFSRRAAVFAWELAYNDEQETRPQTLGVAVADSPVGAAGWIVEKFGNWSDLPKRADGSPDLWARYSEEQLLTDVMLYVATSTVVTASWIYHGKRLEGSQYLPAGTRVEVPTGIAAFPDPVFLPPPRSYAEKSYNVVHWTEMPAGGHFAALEQPDLLLGDLRTFIATSLQEPS